MSACETCGESVIDTPAGVVLNPQPGRLGRHLKDGSALSGDEIRDPAIRGYYEHHCTTRKTPTRTSTQDALF